MEACALLLLSPSDADLDLSRTEYYPLEGFVYARSSFNFNSASTNLVAGECLLHAHFRSTLSIVLGNVAPVIVGNVCLWRPSDSAAYASYLIYQAFQEAGLPASVIQFIPGSQEIVNTQVVQSNDFAALNFSGDITTFKSIVQQVGQRLDEYKNLPRLVGETGGKNFHLIHTSADVDNAVSQTVRAAFDYQGQKHSACSRLYVPRSWWTEDAAFRKKLLTAVQTINSKPDLKEMPSLVEEIKLEEEIEIEKVIDSDGKVKYKEKIKFSEKIVITEAETDMLGPVKQVSSHVIISPQMLT